MPPIQFPFFYLKGNFFSQPHIHIIAISAAFGAFYTFPVYRTKIMYVRSVRKTQMCVEQS